MELTDEEKELFRRHDKELVETPSYHIEEGLVRSYSGNDKDVQITHGYIKKLLLAVARERNLDVNEDETYDMDQLLEEIIEIPELVSDFDPKYYKDYDKLEEYIKTKTSQKNAEEIEELHIEFNGFNGRGGIADAFREFMSERIHRLVYQIDSLYYEVAYTEEAEDSIWAIDDEQSEESTVIEDVPTVEPLDAGVFDGLEDWGDFENLDDFEIGDQTELKEDKVSDEQLIDLIKYINSFPLISKYKENAEKLNAFLSDLEAHTKLKEFHSNKTFIQDFQKIMEHDKKRHEFHFHGTQDLQSCTTILEEGLGMIRGSLSSTSYPEMEMDEILLYSRGLIGEIGRFAVVIIDQPINENGEKEGIVRPIPNNKKIHFSPSGLQGLNSKAKYIIDPKYIVGYVDKLNKKIVFNPRYYDYNKFQIQPNNKRPEELPFTNERIAEGVARFNPNELEQENIKGEE